MSKPIFKLVDEKSRIVIPKSIRESLGIASGDVVAISAEHGSIKIKKAHRAATCLHQPLKPSMYPRGTLSM